MLIHRIQRKGGLCGAVGCDGDEIRRFSEKMQGGFCRNASSMRLSPKRNISGSYLTCMEFAETHNAPVNCAVVTETYPPEVNGVAMTLSRLVGGLDNRGHKVTVIRPRQVGEPDGGPRIHNAAEGLDQWLVAGWPIPFYRSLRVGAPSGWMLKKRWRTERPDIVHIATEGPLGLSALRAARALKIPVSSSFHTNFHQYGGHYGLGIGRHLALRYLRWFHNRTAMTLVPTGQMQAQLASEGFERLRVLSRGVDARLFNPVRRSDALRRSWGAQPDDPVAIYVGRVAAEKQIDLAVEAFQEINAVNPRARFVVVGDGPLRPVLEKRYPNFVYAGMCRGETLAAHYASADIFLFPSTTETFGNVVTEAMASGLVVIGYDYAAVRQHVRQGVNGLMVKFSDRRAFVQAGRDLMSMRSEWPGMRAEARQTAQMISWDVIVSEFESLLQSAVSPKVG